MKVPQWLKPNHDCRLCNEELRSRGHSLLEVLIALGSLSVVLGSATLAISSFSRNPNLETVSRELLAYVDAAHQRALQDRCDLELIFDPSTHQFRNQAEYCAETETFSVPDALTVELNFGGRLTGRMTLYDNGTATPGRIALIDKKSGARCELTQGLRGGRKLTCTKSGEEKHAH